MRQHVRRLMGLLVLIIVGCAKQPAEPPPIAAAPPTQPQSLVAPDGIAPPPAPTDSATAEKDSSTPEAEPDAQDDPPEPAQKATSKKPTSDDAQGAWRIPEGPLDDAKFIDISAKYTTQLLKLPDEERTADAVGEILGVILKEARVTIDEYTDYAEDVAKDQARAARIADSIIEMAKRRGGADITTQTFGKFEDLEEKARLAAPEEEKSDAD